MGIYVALISGLLLCQSGLLSSEIKESQQDFQKAFSQGGMLRAQGEFEKAANVILEALSISRQKHMFLGERRCLVRMAILKWNIGEIPESLSFFAKAQTAYFRAGDKRSGEFCSKCIQLIQFYNLGKDSRNTKLFYRSLDMFDHALVLGREIGLLDFELKCLRQQGATYWELQRFGLFFRNNRKGLEASKKINHKIEETRCLNNIGVYYQKQSNFTLALENIESALSILKTTPNLETEAECFSNLGIIYRAIGNFSRSYFYLSKALELDKRRGSLSSISMDLSNIGSIYLRRGIDHKSKEDLVQALSIYQECMSLQGTEVEDQHAKYSALTNVGIIFNELGDHRKARNFFIRAMSIIIDNNSILEKCQLLCNIATSYLFEKNVERALVNYRLAYELSQKYSMENAISESCLGLGQCYESKSEYSSAIMFYRKAIQAVERLRGRISSESFLIGFMRNKLDAYHRLITIMANQYFEKPSIAMLEELFILIDGAKARALSDSIWESAEKNANVKYLEVEDRKRLIAKNIQELSKIISTKGLSIDKKENIKNELEREEEEYVRLFSEINIKKNDEMIEGIKRDCSLLDVQRSIINKNTVLLEYFIGDKESYLIIISIKNAKLYKLAGRVEIEGSLRGYLRMISDRAIDKDAEHNAAERIGRELLPFKQNEELRNAKALIIVPDGILHYLPFDALRIADNKAIKYLIEKKIISYSPSTLALYLIKNNKSKSGWDKELLAIGASEHIDGVKRTGENGFQQNEPISKIYELGYGLPILPFLKQEIKAIAKQFEKDKVHILLEEEATEQILKKLPLKDYRIIHFACHGIMDERNPYRSALVLSLGNNQEEDGFLQMREIYGLTTSADLIVLSACMTGNGIIEKGEGPMGLVRAFIFAGAKSVVASLWHINDKATVILMKEFYRYIVEGKAAGEALQLAKIRMLKKNWANPFYWAGFFLEGDPSTLGY